MTNGVGPSSSITNGVGISASGSEAALDAALVDVARAAASIEGPLGATVKELSAQFATTAGSAKDTIGATRLEKAMLDFARESKALRIGNPDVAAAAVDAALSAGVAKSASLPDVGMGALDHAVTIFTEAARTLATTPAAPLYDPALTTRT
jgi:hypothetical protein